MKELDIEVPSQEIFEKMKNNSFDNYHNFSNLVTNKDYISQRDSIFKVIHKVSIQLGFKSQTFFLSAHFLDIILTKKKKPSNNLFKLGLAALCLSSKYCENDPMVPHLKYFIRLYNNIVGYKNIISTNNLMNAEVSVCKMLNYRLNYFTIYDFNTFFFSHGLLKFEQLIENDDDSSYKNNQKDIVINSHTIKNILSKIYKKSRYYLDAIIKIYEICIKYNPLYISILIMKKSIEDILNDERNINSSDENCKKEFQKKNDKCFKEIMNEYYKIDYESNEQYQELLKEPEILNVFDPKEANKSEKKAKKDKIKNKNNFRNLSRPRYMASSKGKNKSSNLDMEYNNNTIFTNSVSNGFYRKLKLKPNGYKRTANNSNERKTTTLSKMNNIDNTFDIFENIKKLKISGRIREDKYSLFNNTYKSFYNLNNNKENLQKKIVSGNKSTMKNSHNNSLHRFSTFNNFNNSANNSEYSINIHNLNKDDKIKINDNSDYKNVRKISPAQFDTIYSNDNFNNYKMNNFMKNIKINSLYENTDKSFNTIENNNSKKKIRIYDIERKTYVKKSINNINNINISNREIFSSSKKSLSKASTSNCFYNIKNNISKINTHLQFDSVDRNSPNSINNNIVEFKKINLYYQKIKNQQNDTDNDNNVNSNINIEEGNNILDNELSYKNNHIKIDTSQIVTTTQSKPKKKVLNSNKIANMNKYIINHINNLNKNLTNEVIKEDDDNESDLCSHKDSKKLNKFSTHEHFYPMQKNKNKIYVNTTKALEMKNNEDVKSERGKRLMYLLSQKNSEINNTLKEINKAYAQNFNNKNKIKNENNLSIKNNRINKSKENEITVNILNKNNELNKYKKVNMRKSKFRNIRNKYLIDNHINNDNSINKEKKDKDKTTTSFIKNNDKSSCNIISKKNSIKSARQKFLFKNKNINNNNSNNNFLHLNENISEIRTKGNNKDTHKSSIYQLINKAKDEVQKINEEKNSTITNNLTNNIANDISRVSNLNFYKSQNNFYKNKSIIKNRAKMVNINIKNNNGKDSENNNINGEKDKIANIKNEDEHKSKENSYYKNEININKLNIDNINCQTQKNSSTIIINNTININFGNKKNINGEYVNYKNIYKDNNIPKLNINEVVLNSNRNSINDKNNINKTNSNTNNTTRAESYNNKYIMKNIFHKIPLNRKIINKK